MTQVTMAGMTRGLEKVDGVWFDSIRNTTGKVM